MDQKIKVYIWDMDETLILLKSLINRTYAEAFNGLKDIQNGVDIGTMWENYILQICDSYFFYEQIENCNKPCLDVLSYYDDGQDLSSYDFKRDGFGPPSDDANKRRLAYRHRVISHLYKTGLHSILDEDRIKYWANLYDVTDSYTDRWLSSARTCLAAATIDDVKDSKFKHVNVLVSSGSLVPTLVKCLLFRLDDLIPCENVYSSWEVGKLQCFSWIKERFSGPNVQFCVIGDGWEECDAAEIMRWPFVKVDPKPNSYHRFPGLTLKELGHYFSVVYGKDEDDEIVNHSDNPSG